MYKFLVPPAKVVLFPFFRAKAEGLENIPKDSGYVLAANHTSAWDPIALALVCPDELNFMAKKELFKFKPFAWVLKFLNAFPIDRSGSDVKAIKTALGRLKAGKPLLIFPEGTRLKEQDHTDDDAKDGMIMLAHRSKVPVVPAKIVGKCKIFSGVCVKFGKPVYLDEYYGIKLDSDTMHKISSEVLGEIRKIK